MISEVDGIPVSLWASQQCKNIVAIDTETEQARRGVIPRLFSMQAFDGEAAFFVPRNRILDFFMAHAETTFVFHNAAFDLEVLSVFYPGIYDLVDREYVLDTAILYRLIELAETGEVPFQYSLAKLCRLYLRKELDKDVRDSFLMAKDLTEETMTPEQQTYAIRDALVTRDIFMKQYPIIKDNGWLSFIYQLKGSIALKKMEGLGIGIDKERRDSLKKEMTLLMDAQKEILATYNVIPGVPGFKSNYDKIMKMHEVNLPITKTNNLSSSDKDLTPYKKYPFVTAFLRYKELEKHRSFVYKLQGDRAYPRYTLLKNTGRTSCSNPNFQQLPRQGGIREVFIPSEGYTFLITDYSMIELCALSQITHSKFGHSTMREKINAGVDVHRYYASVLLGKKEEDITKEERQSAKAANFGFPGGLGVRKFVEYANASYGLTITVKEAEKMKDTWFTSFPEMVEYMKEVNGYAETLTGRIRSNCSFCQEKNTPFQGLAADGAKLALYELTKVPRLRLVGFVHDEIVTEVLSEEPNILLMIQEEIMIKAMREVIPDVAITVESRIEKRYCK